MIQMENNPSVQPPSSFPCEEDLAACSKPSGWGDCGDLFACLSQKCDEGGPSQGLSCLAGCERQLSSSRFGLLLNQHMSLGLRNELRGHEQMGTAPDQARYEKCGGNL